MANHLAGARSSYLLQHQDNPVDWHEWGSAAFAEAATRNVPVLLSVGYASCHWCHVMAHESFEDADTAAQINAGFVAIKVDREERPDIDATYMAATQALTGSGGWPMTVFLTPDGAPFYAGTYFPAEPRGGMPSFRQVLAAVTDAWRSDEARVREAAHRLSDRLRTSMTPEPRAASGAVRVPVAPARGGLGRAALVHARDELLAEIDPVSGGFGAAPKFPPAMTLEFLLRSDESTGHRPALDAVTLTLEKMARGGIYDQVGGGFARYSVDQAWHVPHFEKMLTDNALLLRVYAHHARRTGSALSRRIAVEVGDFLLREMRSTTGGFIASLDADSAGVEGLTYRWPLAELDQIVRGVAGEAAVAEILAALGVDRQRPDPEGEVLRLVRDPADPALFAEVRAELARVRAARPQPGRDEIVTVAGNGLTITALADAGAWLERTDWIDAAREVADLLLRGRWGDEPGAGGCLATPAGRQPAATLRRGLFRGEPTGGPAGLADYANLASGLAALYQATGETRYLDTARAVLAVMEAGFRSADGNWFDALATGHDTPAGVASTMNRSPGADPIPGTGAPVIVRPRDPTDGAAPSGMSAAADALTTVAALTGDAHLRDLAEEIAADCASLAARFPRSAGWHLAVAQALASGPLQIAIVGADEHARRTLERVARTHAPGGAVIDIGLGGEPGRPLLADRGPIDGRAAAYVCRGFVCDRPTTDAAEMLRQFAGSDVMRGSPEG